MTTFHSIHLQIFVISDKEKKTERETSEHMCLELVYESMDVWECGDCGNEDSCCETRPS